jgi:hypothetical protein
VHGLPVEQAIEAQDADALPASLGAEALMRKIYCDSCGGECVNTTVHFHGAIQHTTNKGEQVGYDELSPIELCTNCAEPVIKAFGMEIRPQSMDSEMAIARPVPPPLMVSEVPG